MERIVLVTFMKNYIDFLLSLAKHSQQIFLEHNICSNFNTVSTQLTSCLDNVFNNKSTEVGLRTCLSTCFFSVDRDFVTSEC